MATANVYSGSSVYIPSFEASGQLRVELAQNPSTFAINKYTTQRKTDKDVGRYLLIDPDEAVRIVNQQDTDWADGNDAPANGNTNDESFNFLGFTTRRKAYPWTLGNKTVQQAAWDILASHSRISASKAMVDRTLMAQSALSGASWGANTGTATALGGGLWGSATTSNLYIKKTLLAAAQVVCKATNNVVQPNDLVLLINPTVAIAMAETDEFHNYVKGSYWAMDVLQGKGAINSNALWGLTPEIYGFPIVVEPAIYATNKKGGTRSTSYVMDSNTAYLISRKEGLISGMSASAPSWSTITSFVYEDMTVESFQDVNNRRTSGRVVQDLCYVVTATASGYSITGVLS